PNLSPGRTPSQAVTGCGGFQRSSPMGGAPNGIPLKTATPSSLPGTPATSPSVVCTGELSKRAVAPAAAPEGIKPAIASMASTCLMSHLQRGQLVDQALRVGFQLIQQRLEGLFVDALQEHFFCPVGVGARFVEDLPPSPGQACQRQ